MSTSEVNQIRTALENLQTHLIIVLLEGQTYVETPHTFTVEIVPEIQILSYLIFGNPETPLFDRSSLSEISVSQVNWNQTHITHLILNLPVPVLTDLLAAKSIHVYLEQNPQTFYLPVQLDIYYPNGTVATVQLPKFDQAIYNDLEDKNWLSVPQPTELIQQVQTIIGTLGGPKLRFNAALIETNGLFSFYKGLN